MHPINPQNPSLMQVASQAQNLARSASQERIAIAFQTVSMVSMALVGFAATIQVLREMKRTEHRRDRA